MNSKLSTLLSKFKSLENVENVINLNNVEEYVSAINTQIDDLSIVDNHELKQAEANLLKSVEEYRSSIANIKQNLNNTYFSNSKEYQNISDSIWRDNSEKMTFNEHLHWTPLWPPSVEEQEKLIVQIKRYANWQIPGLIYGAKDTDLITALNGVNPIYIVDNYKEYADLQKSKFDPAVARRMRFYHLDNVTSLPNNAIGLIVIYNELPFLPWSMSNALLKILSRKLRPGGVIIFNYNDCNTVKGLKYFEDRNMVFTTFEMFDNLLTSTDLSFVEKYNSAFGDFSYLIYTKNGEQPLVKKYPMVGLVKSQTTLINPEGHYQKMQQIYKLVRTKDT